MGCSANSDVAFAVGSDHTLAVSVVDGDGAAYDLTGATGHLVVRKCADGDAVIELETGVGGSSITDAPGGKMEFVFSVGDTDSLDARRYIYDVWIVTSGGKNHQVVPVSAFRLDRRVVEL